MRSMLSNGQKDNWAIALLFAGIALAVMATFLPVIQVTGRAGVLTMTTWDVLPWFAKVKFLALGLLLAAAFLPQLRKWRMLIAAVAVVMVFVPAISSFISALYAWGTVRADLVRLSGERTPFVHPGIANAVLVAAAVTVSYAVWRIETLSQPAEAGTPLAA
jgi:predicted Abi (CAAX) family protease